MSTPYWTSTVSSIGGDAADMVDAGVVILFGEPVPPALADVSVVHRPDAEPTRDLAVGDRIVIGDQEVTVQAVGELASQNLRELGHVVLYTDPGDQKLLPGAVHVTGSLSMPNPGEHVAISGA